MIILNLYLASSAEKTKSTESAAEDIPEATEEPTPEKASSSIFTFYIPLLLLCII